MAGQAGSKGASRTKSRLFRHAGWALLLLSTVFQSGCLLAPLNENTGNGAAPASSTPASVMSLLAGGAGGTGSSDGQGANARFYLPQGVAVDTVNHLVFVADTANNTIRVVTAGGSVSTLVGQAGTSGSVDTVTQNGTTTPTATGKAIGDVLLSAPTGLAIQTGSGTDTLYVADTGNATVRMITLTATASGATATQVTTIAGLPGQPGSSPGPYGVSRMATPAGLALDGSGQTLYVVDTSNSTVLQIDLRTPAQGGIAPSGLSSGITLAEEASAFELTTVAGSATANSPASKDGVGTQAAFDQPVGIAYDTYNESATGTVTSPVLYVADAGGNTVRALYYNSQVQNWVVTTLAGDSSGTISNGVAVGTAGYSDGGTPASYATTAGPPSPVPATPYHVVQAGSNYSFTVDVRKFTVPDASGGTTTTTTTKSPVLFNLPTGIMVDPADHTVLYVTDAGNDVIRKLVLNAAAPVQNTTSSGSTTDYNTQVTVSTIVGMVPVPAAPTVATAGADPASAASLLYYPGYADSTASGLSTNVWEQYQAPNPVISAAQLSLPAGLASDGAGGIFLADMGNSLIRHITPAGSSTGVDDARVVVTTAGSVAGVADAEGALAGFNAPQGLDADAAGNVYVADSGNDLLRKIDSSGNVTTLAGLAGVSGESDGLAGAARFNSPAGLVVDRLAKKIYVADSGSGAIRVSDLSGNVSTLSFSGASLLQPVALALDAHGHLYVADQGTSSQAGKVVAINLASHTATVLPAGTLAPVHPGGIAVTADGATVYVADGQNATIDVFTTSSSLWGPQFGTGVSGYADGNVSSARFYQPSGLALDPAGDLLVADQLNQVVRKVALGASPVTVSTVLGAAGDSGYSYTVPGLLSNPLGLGMSGTTLYLSAGNRILTVSNM